MNTVEMLASIIILLGEVEVRGEANMKRMAELFARLGAVLNGVKDENAKHAQELAALNEQLRNRPAAFRINPDGSATVGGEIIDLDTGEVVGNVNDPAE